MDNALLILREGSLACVFGIAIVWIVYFAGLIDRDVLLISNGVLIVLMIISGILKRRHSVAESNRNPAFRPVRRQFPRGAIIRSGSNPDITPEDEAVISRIQSVFICRLIDANVVVTPYETSPYCPSCVICLVDFEEGDQTFLLSGCSHFFHSNCIVDWLASQISTSSSEGSPSCPTCRTKLTMPDEAMQSFVDQVSSPGFLSNQLSRRIHLVFNQYRSGTTTPDPDNTF